MEHLLESIPFFKIKFYLEVIFLVSFTQVLLLLDIIQDGALTDY